MESSEHSERSWRDPNVTANAANEQENDQRNTEDRKADLQDLDADSADAAANARDLDADLRDRSAEAGDTAAAKQNHGLLPSGRRRARSDRKAAAVDRGQAGNDRSRARSDRGASRQARANAAQDRAVATDVETDLIERLIKADDSAADMLLIGEAQGVLMATRSLDATEAAAEICAQAARDKRKLGDVANRIITEADHLPEIDPPSSSGVPD